MADFRTANIHLGHAGSGECPLITLDAIRHFQWASRIFIVHKQAKRACFDIDLLLGREADAGRFRDPFVLATSLDRQHMTRSVNV